MKMANPFQSMLYQLAFYSFGLFNWCLYLGLSIYSQSFFKKDTKQDQLQLALARDKFWNLSKTVAGLSHRFYKLRDGRQLHYLTNNPEPRSSKSVKPLVILIHGFPDSSVMWRHVLESNHSLGEKAILVAVDLPGYGGSDGCKKYNPEEVLEALTEFIVGMREMYIDGEYNDGLSNGTEQGSLGSQQVYIVGHDWGCVLAYRLASEASGLADRFIVTNGPLVSLALSNKDNILDSSAKIFNTFLQAPVARRSCLRKSFDTLKPLLLQLLMFGYIAAFHLPGYLVTYLGTGGNYAFLRGALRSAYGKDKSEFRIADSMASTLGPSELECKTCTSQKTASTYSPMVCRRAQTPGAFFFDMTAYYTDGAATQKWEKSLETIAALYNIECENADNPRRRNSSASSGIFDLPYVGSLRAPTTVLWGKKDQACTQRICLDGIGDYLAKDSQVVLLPRTGHWTAVEKESRITLGKVIEWYVDSGGEKGDVGDIVKQVYPDATVIVRK